MKIYNHYDDFPMEEWRWPNFSPREIACRAPRGAPGYGKLAIDEDAMDKLQALRNALGRPMIINSAYRPPEYNRLIGGAKNSYHMRAVAFDVSMANQEPGRFETVARRNGFTGFGFYRRNGFIHIDTGPKREWGKRWFSPEQRNNLPVEQPLAPEKATQDGSIVGATIGTGGVGAAASASAAVIPRLEPLAQVLVIGGLAVAV